MDIVSDSTPASQGCEVRARSNTPPVCDDCVLARWEPAALALRAISASPICQCIDSTARQGICISLEIACHISDLNLSLSIIFVKQPNILISGNTFRKGVQVLSCFPRSIPNVARGSSDSVTDSWWHCARVNAWNSAPTSCQFLAGQQSTRLRRPSTLNCFFCAGRVVVSGSRGARGVYLSSVTYASSDGGCEVAGR